MSMNSLPWSEDYMLRQSYPLYDEWCREDEERNYQDPADAADDYCKLMRDLEEA